LSLKRIERVREFAEDALYERTFCRGLGTVNYR